MLATRLGAAAVESLARGEQGVLVGMIRSEIAITLLGARQGGYALFEFDVGR